MRLWRGLRYTFYFVKCVAVGLLIGVALIELTRWWK